MELEEKLQPAREPDAGINEMIFALDIGTRSVIGIVGVPEGDMLKVMAAETVPHTKRAVVDGQIEDIAQTAHIAGLVKERLEQTMGCPLREVHIAAAGRALITRRAEAELALDDREAILDRQVTELETSAIQAAYAEMEKEKTGENEQDFICVGHSVVKYWLDGYEMSTLLDHRGSKARVDIIATFLPGEVIESLYAVMAKVGLTVKSVTLEPIAAMNAVIPRELRMLNLALVDIGGGTSDIAISNGGSVSAYTMATVAGDEITEKIMQECLVDFETAEQVKLELSRRPAQIQYRDILGFHYELSHTELLQKIQPAVDELAEEISSRILEANEKSPAAVFLVGGGCQISVLCGMIAKRLSIDEKKVAVGGSNYMKRMIATELDVTGPEFATPIGIAVTAMSNQMGKRLSITLNGKRVALLKHGLTTVLELLLLNGCQYGQIMGRSGAGVAYTINGEKRLARGEISLPAEITINGAAAGISSPIQPEDNIVFRPARAGADASPIVGGEVKGYRRIRVILNGEECMAGTQVLLNGEPADRTQRIRGGDELLTSEVSTLGELCTQKELLPAGYNFFVGGTARDMDYVLEDGDILRAVPKDIAATAAPAMEVSLPAAPSASAFTAAPPASAAAFPEAGSSPASTTHVRLNGKEVELFPKPDGSRYQFVDMLNFVNIDPSKPQGNILLRINGRDASYLDTVGEGDAVDIRWD